MQAPAQVLMRVPAFARGLGASVAMVALAAMGLMTIGQLIHPVASPPDVPSFPLVQAMVHWDAGWYGEIAQNGYWLSPGQQSPVVFFPAFPMAIRALMVVFGLNRWVAGIAVSLTCGLTALFLFHRWVRTVAPSAAPSALWLLALYPYAEYLYGFVYSDAMYLAFAIGAFLALEKDKPFLAALLGAVATAARPVAPALVIGLLVRSLERRRALSGALRLRDWVPALAGLGLAGYMAFLFNQFGDALAFVHAQSAPGWDQPPGWHSWLKETFFQVVFTARDPLVPIRLGSHALATIGALALGVATHRRLGIGYAAYALLVIGIPAVSSKDFMGLGRYVLAAFPIFVTAALMLGERPHWRKRVYVVSAALLGVCALALGAGGYVA